MIFSAGQRFGSHSPELAGSAFSRLLVSINASERDYATQEKLMQVSSLVSEVNLLYYFYLRQQESSAANETLHIFSHPKFRMGCAESS